MPTGSKKKPGPLSAELGDTLRAEMARERISIKALADAVGMSAPQVSGVLNAKKHVDVEQLDAICWALGLDTLKVFSDVDAATVDRHIRPEWTVTLLVQR